MPTIEIKVNKRFLINFLLIVITLVALLEAVELGLIAYSLKAGLLCK